jgi:catechol 2,3-dioxygenase-like lactoylglutathione lyase family enzyme
MNSEHLKNNAFGKPHHICIVVKDIEKTKNFYESIGIGPWTEYPPLVEYTKLNVIDEKGFFATRFVYTKIGDLQLQLVQPGEGKTIYKEFLEKKGEGVFHIGFEVADIDTVDKQLTENGLNILASGRRDDGSGFSYYDTRQHAGVTLLIRQTKLES